VSTVLTAAGCGGGGSTAAQLGCNKYCQDAGAPEGNGPAASQIRIDTAGDVVPGSNGTVAIKLTCVSSHACDGGALLLAEPFRAAPGLSADCAPTDPCAGRSNIDIPAKGTRTIGVHLSAPGRRVLDDYGRIELLVMIEFPPDLFESNISPVALALGPGSPRGTLKLDAVPQAMATTPGRLWVAIAANTGKASVLQQFDAQTGRPVGAPVTLGGAVSAMVVSAGDLWVGTGTQTGAATRIIPISIAGGRPVGRPVALGDNGEPKLAASGGLVWALADDGIVGIDPATERVSSPISYGSASPVGMAATVTNLWLAAQTDVLRIGFSQGKLYNQPIPLRSQALATDGNIVWSADYSTSSVVSRINADTGAIVGAPVPVGSGASAIAIGGGSVWVVNGTSDTVSRIDESTATVTGAPIKVGPVPGGIAIGDGTVWVANTGNNTITAIHAATGTVRDIGG
jgi:DNA-binding beta-propeller fold protein YncE